MNHIGRLESGKINCSQREGWVTTRPRQLLYWCPRIRQWCQGLVRSTITDCVQINYFSVVTSVKG